MLLTFVARRLEFEPERRVWHWAASIIGTDERVACELETAEARGCRRGPTVAAVSALLLR